jgi:hypothetical protein
MAAALVGLLGMALLMVVAVAGTGMALARRRRRRAVAAVAPERYRLVLAPGMTFEQLRGRLAGLGLELVTSSPEPEPVAACWIDGSDRLAYMHARPRGPRTLEVEGPRAARHHLALQRQLSVDEAPRARN